MAMDTNQKVHFFVFAALLLFVLSQAHEEIEAKMFLALYNQRVLQEAGNKWTSLWDHATDINDRTLAGRTLAELKFSTFQNEARVNASRFYLDKLSKDTRRQINIITRASVAMTNVTKQRELINILGKMVEVYNLAKVNHPLIGKGLSLYPDLMRIMETSRNVSVLLATWQEWRAMTGSKIRPLYNKFVQLSNEAVKENHWKDTGAWWRSWYETESLPDDVERLWLELKPFYMELHAYVRHRLQQQYPVIIDSQPIPAHLLGNMWSQSWINIYSLVEPYRQTYNPDLTNELEKRRFKARKILEFAESFFVSIGLGKLPASFYDNSLIEKPKGPRQVDCHPSAWDLYVNNRLNQHDVRIKQCMTVSYRDLITAHHQLGHMYYYLGYWNLPYSYRGGANPAFHAALGKAIVLSVETPQHLVKTELVDAFNDNTEAEINALMMSALDKVAFLPFAYLVDQWRWKVFQGDIQQSDYNKKWWQLRTTYQGIKPPSSRDESNFDAGAKYHIPANIPYVRYFISTVLQFDFHKAACQSAGFVGPLHRCSIYGSKKAGNKIRTMINMGRRKHWRQVLKQMTGSNGALNTRSLKEYYKPLYDWLLKQRCQIKYTIGWNGAPGPTYNPCHPPTFLPSTQTPTSNPIQGQGLQQANNLVHFIMLAIALLTWAIL